MSTCPASQGKPICSQVGQLCRVLILALALLPALPVEKVMAGPGGPRTISTTATLSILAGTVERIPAAGGQKQSAKDGMDLAVGDRILTGEKSTALITFLDGSTVTVQPESEVMIKKADIGEGKPSSISVHIDYGTVWARVARAFYPNSSFSLASNAATATAHSATASVHDSLIGGRVNSNNSFECWTRAGMLKVVDEEGQRYVILQPGEKTTVTYGQFNARFGFRLDPDPLPRPFSVNQSALRITTSAGVLPLVLMDDKARRAGFLAPSGIAVNQVFGSYTGVVAGGEHVVEVPAGVKGPFMLLLEGVQDGSFTASIIGTFNGEPIYEHKLSGTIKKGERLSATITQELDPDLASHEKMAKVVSGRVTPLQTFSESLPDNILMSPMEAGKIR